LLVILAVLAVALAAVVYAVRRKKLDAAVALALAAILVAFFARPIENGFDSILGTRADQPGAQTAMPPSTGTANPSDTATPQVTAAPSASQSARIISSPTSRDDTPAYTPSTADSPRTGDARSMFVADFEDADVTSSSNSYQTGSVELGGQPYSRSSHPTCLYKNTSTEYTLSKKWALFEATVGIKDQNPEEYSANVTIYRDGDLWRRPLQVKVGSPEPVNIDVTGVVKLKIVCSPGAGHEGFIRLALGDALVSTRK
jgi:hypothetical protein